MLRNEYSANLAIRAGLESGHVGIRNVSPMAVRKARAAIESKRAKRGLVSRLVSFFCEVL